MPPANPIVVEAANNANKAAAVVNSRKRKKTAATTAQLNFANFNQDFSCVSVGYNNGYKVYNCTPFGQCYQRAAGSVGIVEMLFTSSLLAIVGTGEQDALSPRRLKVVNTKRSATICEFTFPDTILAVKINRERLVVLLESTVYIYNINNMRLLHTVEIPTNSMGLLALSSSIEHNFLAYPSPPRIVGDSDSGTRTDVSAGGPGGVGGGASGSGAGDLSAADSSSQIRRGDVVVFDCKTLQPVSVIEAHKAPLAAIALSRDGTLLATASDKGTIVRVFSVEKGTKLYQFRRGTYATKIYSLAFSADNQFVVASSATETVHVFRLGEEEMANTKRINKRRKAQKDRAAAAAAAAAGIDDDDSSNFSDDSDNAIDDNSEEAYDVLEPLPGELERKKSNSSSESGSTSTTREPVVDSSRRSVARMLRRTSQTLGRKAAEKMGGYLPPRFSSILEPNRHFASCKVPATKDTTTIVGIGRVCNNLIPAVYLNGEEHAAAQGSSTAATVMTAGTNGDADLVNRRVIEIMVVTSEGFFYTFGLDPDRGGDCVLLNQRSLLE